MSDRTTIGSDDSAFRGRLRQPEYIQRPTTHKPGRMPAESRMFEDVLQNTEEDLFIENQPPTRIRERSYLSGGSVSEAAVMAGPVPAARSQADQDEEFDLEPVGLPGQSAKERYWESALDLLAVGEALAVKLWAMRHDKHAVLRAALLAMATLVLVIGIVVSLQTSRANSAAAAQIQAIYEEAELTQ